MFYYAKDPRSEAERVLSPVANLGVHQLVRIEPLAAIQIEQGTGTALNPMQILARLTEASRWCKINGVSGRCQAEIRLTDAQFRSWEITSRRRPSDTRLRAAPPRKFPRHRLDNVASTPRLLP